MKLKSLLLICMLFMGEITILNVAYAAYNDYSSASHTTCTCQQGTLETCENTNCLYQQMKMTSSPTNDSMSLLFVDKALITPEQQQEPLPLPQAEPLQKTLDPQSSSWFSTLCVLSGLSIIGYDIYETNKLKKEEADDAIAEPFFILENQSKKTEETKQEIIDTKEINEQEIIETVVITPKPVLHNSRQRPIKPVAHPTIESEQTDRFAFIKNLPNKIHPHYKAGKKQSKTWFKDLKQNPRQHKKLAAAATLFTLALVKNWIPGLKDL